MLQPPVALVTGSAVRIGAEVVRHLHTAGYCVIIHFRQSEIQARELVDELTETREKSAFCIQADLSNDDDLKKLALRAHEQWGRIDLLVNNASSFFPTPLGSCTLGQWDELIASNAKAPFFLSQLLLPELKKVNGSIVNIIDIHANAPLKNHTVYCMAKSALSMMTLSLAKELAPEIRVNGVAPGAVLWPKPEDEMLESEKQTILASVPLNRLGKATEIAEAVHFLASSKYITGQIIAVDGGRSL